MRRHRPDPLTLTVEEAADLLGISRTLAYELAKNDRLPVPVISLGRRRVISRRALERALERDLRGPFGSGGGGGDAA